MSDATPELLGEARPHSHFVQLHAADERSLLENVGRYAAEGLIRDEAVVVIATTRRRTAIAAAIRQAGSDPAAAIARDQLIFLDANETLRRFMIEGQPDPQRFDDVVGTLVRDLRERAVGLRAYGEMVGVLWEAERYAAAIRLEELWNALLAANDFELFCAYPIDVFGTEFRSAEVDALLSTHTHLLPGSAELQRSVDRAMDEVLGCRAEGVRALSDRACRPDWAALPNAEAAILWLRTNLPDYAGEILARARRYSRTAA